MANTFPIDGNAGVGIDEPTLGLLQLQLTQEQATNDRVGLALSVAGDANQALLYPRSNGAGGYDWYLTRNRQDDQGLKLDIAGNVAFAKDVVVSGALKIKNWELSVPDFVFGRDYRLPGLEEVADFVREYGHLPEVPSAVEVGSQGLDAAQMILVLLKKVEEITLYLLRHEGRLASIETRVGPGSAP